MKVFGIISLVIASILCAMALINGITSWFKRNKKGFIESLLDIIIYAIWIITAVFLIKGV